MATDTLVFSRGFTKTPRNQISINNFLFTQSLIPGIFEWITKEYSIYVGVVGPNNLKGNPDGSVDVTMPHPVTGEPWEIKNTGINASMQHFYGLYALRLTDEGIMTKFAFGETFQCAWRGLVVAVVTEYVDPGDENEEMMHYARLATIKGLDFIALAQKMNLAYPMTATTPKSRALEAVLEAKRSAPMLEAKPPTPMLTA